MQLQLKPTKRLEISPSDLSLSVWNWDAFHKRCVLKEYQDPTVEMLIGSFAHAYVWLPKEEKEEKNIPILLEFKELLDKVSEQLTPYTPEQSFSHTMQVDDTEVVLNWRVDGIDYKTGNVIELKFPTKDWGRYTSQRVSDIKNLCYCLAHQQVEVWEIMLSKGIVKHKVKWSKEEAEEKVKEQLRQVIGRLTLNYF